MRLSARAALFRKGICIYFYDTKVHHPRVKMACSSRLWRDSAFDSLCALPVEHINL